MSCFFRKKRNRVQLANQNTIEHETSNDSNTTNNNTINNNIISRNEAQNIREYTELLENRYTINSNNELTINNSLIDESNISNLTLSNYDVKTIIADNNLLYNNNLKLIKNINVLLYNKLKLEHENLNLKVKIKSLETNYIENTKDIIVENERLNNNIKSIIDINNTDELYLCTICMDNIRDIIITPCYHSVVCNNCINKIKNCPICRNEIKNTIKYYF